MRRKQFTSLPWLFVVVRDPHSRPKQEWSAPPPNEPDLLQGAHWRDLIPGFRR
jgi:hypothetical protein